MSHQVLIFYSIYFITAFFSKVRTFDDCSLKQVNDCFKDFNSILNQGPRFLITLNQTQLENVCSKLWKTRNCATPFLFFCPESSQELRGKLEKFEYACTVNRTMAGWPELPGHSAAFVDSIVKASLAACVTVILVCLCFISSQVSAFRINRRVRQQQKMKGSLVVKTLEHQAEMISGFEQQLIKQQNSNQMTKA